MWAMERTAAGCSNQIKTLAAYQQHHTQHRNIQSRMFKIYMISQSLHTSFSWWLISQNQSGDWTIVSITGMLQNASLKEHYNSNALFSFAFSFLFLLFFFLFQPLRICHIAQCIWTDDSNQISSCDELIGFIRSIISIVSDPKSELQGCN